MKIVFVENNRPVTDSLMVAETFGKNHKDVLRDIRNLDCSEEFGQRNFAHTPYVHEQNGQEYHKYLITQDGFSFLVMGYTGKEAARFKETYINEFNRMRDELNKPQFTFPQTKVEALEAYLQEMKKNEMLTLENAYKDDQIAKQAPKVALYDVAMNASNNKAIGTVAKMLGYGPYKLFAFLREVKVLRHNNDPYQTYIDRGYFELRIYPVPHTNGEIENKNQTMVTPKGIDFIHKLLVENGKITNKGETA